MKWPLFFVFALLLSSCASTPQHRQGSQDEPEEYQEIVEDGLDESLLEAQKRSLQKIAKQFNRNVASTDKEDPQPIVVKKPEPKYEMETQEHLPKVKKWIKYYSKKDRKRFQRFLNRGARYKEIVQDLLVTNGLPPDLYYLAILESGYVTKALSRAGAVGAWQFMAPTGRQYGLKINSYVDERIDPIRSTLAAIRYLKELHRQKKSWYLALASYNAGPGRVGRAMRRGGTRDYWSLTRRRLLPYDTREYIPQFLAILTIGRNLEKYGFHEVAKKPWTPVELVKVPSPIKLSHVAEATGLSVKDIKKYNFHLKKDVTPPTKSKVYRLWIKKEISSNVLAKFDAMKTHRIKSLRVPSRVAKSFRFHRVRRGQNLSYIARRYGTSVGRLKRINNLRSSRIYIGQRLRVRQGRSYASVYRVRRGDNLSEIARRHGTSVSKIKRINGLRSNRIMVGQKIKVKGKAKNRSITQYRVRRGDNLTEIARRFGTSVGKIKRLNGMRSSRIFVGQRLKLRGKARSGKVAKYKVQRGDNLTEIAKEHGVSVSKLKRINGLSSGRILVGQTLKIQGSRSKPTRYRIRPGDNLYKIAKKFGTTIRAIKRLNNLKTNNILKGQYLIIARN